MIKITSKLKKRIILEELSVEERSLLEGCADPDEQLRVFSAIQAVKDAMFISRLENRTDTLTIYIDKDNRYRVREYPGISFNAFFDDQYITVTSELIGTYLKRKGFHISKSGSFIKGRQNSRIIPVPDLRKKK